MATKYVGVVDKIFDKTWDGGKTTYSVRLEGNPLYFRMGTKRFSGIAEPGQTISFDADMAPDNKSAKIVGDVVKARPEPKAPPESAPAGSRDASIQYQSSRKDALVFLEILLAQGALKIPVKQNQKVATIEAALDLYTAQFFKDIDILGALERQPAAKDPAERERLVANFEFIRTPEGIAGGFGNLTPARVQGAIDTIRTAFNIDTPFAAGDLYMPQFLPPAEQLRFPAAAG